MNGPNGDNLSLLTLRWESRKIKSLGEVSTRPFDPSQTIIENLQSETSKARALSDAEIMSAIESIRTNLKKNRPPETAK